jgi:FlaA1/EpsC-like NDP-sugar epimerase
LKVNKDINIVFGKLKKGEKISEKLKYDFEKSLKTQTDKLLALEVHNPRESIDFELFKKNLEDLIYKNSISSTKIESMIRNEIKNFI